jgi:hypothetical protein
VQPERTLGAHASAAARTSARSQRWRHPAAAARARRKQKRLHCAPAATQNTPSMAVVVTASAAPRARAPDARQLAPPFLG